MPTPHTRTTAERGYGAAHKRLRAWWAPRVRRGTVACARCGWLIEPDEPWDLGHDDDDRNYYTGPEHRDCNRRAGAAKATAARLANREARGDAPITSRDW